MLRLSPSRGVAVVEALVVVEGQAAHAVVGCVGEGTCLAAVVSAVVEMLPWLLLV
jgi:hypothetical protein